MIWIGFTIAHNALTSTITPTLNQQLTSINNNFDAKTLGNLQKRQQITPQYIISVVVSQTPTPTPTLVPISPINPQPTNASSSGQQGGATPTP